MKKGRKIKRYGNIYGRGLSSGSVVIIIAMVVGVLIFGFLGWVLYTPVSEFFQQLNTQDERDLQLDSVQNSSQGSGAVSQTSGSSEPPVITPLDIEGFYIPISLTIDNLLRDGSVQRAKNGSLNAVLVDAKDASGVVLFNSSNNVALSSNAVSETAFSAKEMADYVHSQGMVPAARLHAFRDSTAAFMNREMAVSYYDTSTTWLDNSLELGGKPWLNPYSSEAQKYISDLSIELAENGFEIIILDSVQFPSGVGTEKAGYGNAGGKTRNEALLAFVENVSRQLEARGAQLVIAMPSGHIITGDEAKDEYVKSKNDELFGGNPALYKNMLLTLSPGQGEAEAKQASLMSDIAKWMYLIPAYSADGAVQDVSATVARIDNIDQLGYILYNPQGNYKLS